MGVGAGWDGSGGGVEDNWDWGEEEGAKIIGIGVRREWMRIV